ncbi:J domain-containing protein [Helicobacter sp. 23-1044]
MRVEALNKFVQISIEEYNPNLPKVLNYAKKHFQKHYHLSSSILILDDGVRLKKDYFINWAYHLATQGSGDEIGADLEPILAVSFLPIRIKIISANALVERVKVSFHILSANRAVLILDKPNHTAKRYIGAFLSHLVVSSDLCHIYLDMQNSAFWKSIMEIIESKIIHNVRLEFDYESFKGGKSPSYLTKSEQILRNAYKVLGVGEKMSFFEIRAKYLEQIKRYHPDKVFNKDSATISAYNARFIEVKEAFDIIKRSFELAS